MTNTKKERVWIADRDERLAKERKALLVAIRRCSLDLKTKYISSREYEAWAKANGRPQLWRIWYHQKSTWAELAREAGRYPKQNWRADETEFLKVFRLVAHKLGRGPFVHEYNSMRKRVDPMAPSAGSISRRLGLSWKEVNKLALEGTGLKYSEKYRAKAKPAKTK